MALPVRTVVSQILSLRPSVIAIREAVTFFHHVAVTYLRHKASAGNLTRAHLGLCLEDLALDCISGLFARDGQGSFPVLNRYLSSVHWDSLSEVDLVSAVRRLVFSHVNHELYRTYRESDPTLHRIIRNIKDSTQSTPGILMTERGGENWVSFTEELASPELPVAPPEYIGPYVTMLVARCLDTKQILLELGRILRDQREYEPGYPVVYLALLFRSAHSTLAGDSTKDAETSSAIEEDLQRQDLDRLLVAAVTAVGGRLRSSYVDRGKTSRELLETYVATTVDILRAEYLTDSDHSGSFVDHLRRHLPAISAESYRNEHRYILEYLVKLARQEYLNTIRQES